MASTRGFRDSATVRRPNHTFAAGASENKTSNTCEENTEDCKDGAEDWPVQSFELSKDSTIANFQIHKTAFKRRHHPMKATRTTSILEPSSIEPTNCLKQVLQSQRNHGRTDQINRGKVIRNLWVGTYPIFVGPINVPQFAVSGEMPNEQVPAMYKKVQETVTMGQVSSKSKPTRGLCLLKRTDGPEAMKEDGHNEDPGNTAWRNPIRPHFEPKKVRQEACKEGLLRQQSLGIYRFTTKIK